MMILYHPPAITGSLYGDRNLADNHLILCVAWSLTCSVVKLSMSPSHFACCALPPHPPTPHPVLLLLEKLFFSSGGTPVEPSVNDFYRQASNGNISLTGEVVGPYCMPYDLNYYANHKSGMSAQEPSTRTLGQHAAEAVNRDDNLGPLTSFDNNGDSYMVRGGVTSERMLDTTCNSISFARATIGTHSL